MAIQDPLRIVGTTVAEKYAVEEVVGEGGSAVVYRATHLIWKRPVALKVFRALADVPPEKREEFLQAFFREGALLAELSERSAAICQARDIATLTTPSGEWLPYMVLEWLEGETLEQALVRERQVGLPPRTPGEALNLLAPVAEAIALAHARGIAHRDVKPANIFVLGDPRSDSCPIKIADFGIAKVVQDAQKVAGSFTKTVGELTSFTPAYGAPEQFSRAIGATGPWTDVFALGLIISQLLSGRDPLGGDTLQQLAFASVDPNVRPTPRTLGAIVPDAVEAVLARALAVKLEDRYRSVGEFWGAFRAALGLPPMRGLGDTSPTGSIVLTSSGERPTAGPPVPVAASSQAAVAPPSLSQPLATAVPSPASPPRKSPMGGMMIGGAVLVVGLGIGSFFALRGERGAIGKLTRAPAASSSAGAPPSASVALAAPPPPAAACPDGMIRIPGGRFFMGSDEQGSLENERPAHAVSLSPYCIDRFEVTVEQYKSCSDVGACLRASKENDWAGITPEEQKEQKAYDPLCNIRDPEGRARHPINCVSWDNAANYCKMQGKRLPTEAEWEFAARGPDGRTYPWGDERPSAKRLNACGKECVAWGKKNRIDGLSTMYAEDDGWPTTAPVGSFPDGKSRYGVEDVVGNVWEWVGDWYAPYGETAQTDPEGPASGEGRVIRGGAWNGAQPSWVRPTFRYYDVPTKKSHGYGFRCAKALSKPSGT